MFPEFLQFSIESAVNDAVDWLVRTHGDAFEAFANGILAILIAIEGVVRVAPWWAVTLVIAGFAWHAARQATLAVAAAASMTLIGALGFWDLAMQTLALMIVAVAAAVVVGVPIGLVMAGSDRARAALTPMLDAMQTLPSFVYLIPALMLFGLGKVPALIATVIYAVPPLIRLTDLGLREVDAEVTEAARAFGATGRQIMLGVRLPLALPAIMAGINQTIMMALSMVVIASMIGARGLGEQVLLGIQRLDVGRGFAAGLAIVALAIVFDRISQAYGRRVRARFGAG